MNSLKQAMLKAGFADYEKARTREAKREWFYKNGLSSVLPVKQVKLHLGVERTAGGLTLLCEEYAFVPVRRDS